MIKEYVHWAGDVEFPQEYPRRPWLSLVDVRTPVVEEVVYCGRVVCRIEIGEMRRKLNEQFDLYFQRLEREEKLASV
jgi:hypothetical protein